MAYEIIVTSKARRGLRRLPAAIQSRVAEVVERLAENPRPPGCRALQGRRGIWRIRFGSYQVLYQVFEQQVRILILKVGHRKNVYRL